MDNPTPAKQPYSAKTTAVVVTTAMLTFISFWRAAAIVLCDLSSSAYYACGVAEHMIGKAAPWFVLGIMIFSLPIHLVFMESCAMFVRGGVYRVVKAAIGSTLAKIAVSALLFDFILTGPISAISAGQYLINFYNQFVSLMGHADLHVPESPAVVTTACVIILYFWRQNIIGVEESSRKSLWIVHLTSVMIVLLLVWSVVTLILHPAPLPPFRPEMQEHALGWLHEVGWVKMVGLAGVVIALGHSVLALSGEETLAQVYREIGAPKMRNLRKAVALIFTYSLLLTGVISLLAVMIIPDLARPSYRDNLLSGLAMYLAGPAQIKIWVQAFVVLVGVLLLSGAVNTAIVGSNGVFGRLAEDGILPAWFRRLHRRYGTTSRMINTFAILQLAIAIASRGDVIALGEAYAFGVLWSIVFITLSVLVLRWRDRTPREYRVPINIRIGHLYVPVGIGIVLFVLRTIATANFFTKSKATQYGVLFTVVSFCTLFISEKINRRRQPGGASLEQVNLAFKDTATPEGCGLRHKYRVVAAVRDPNNLSHLRRTLERIDPKKSDLIVVTVRRTPLPAVDMGDLPADEQVLITNVVALAEKYGVHVTPIIVPATDPIYATAKAAYDLGASEIVLGRSGRTNPEVQLEKLAMAWGFVSADEPRRMTLRVAWPQKEIKFELG